MSPEAARLLHALRTTPIEECTLADLARLARASKFKTRRAIYELADSRLIDILEEA